MIINDELIPKNQFDKEYIEKFLKESTKGIKLNTIITDGHGSYPEIIERLGVKHQLCIFQIMQNLMTKLNPYIHKKERSKNRRIKEQNTLKKRKAQKIRQNSNKQHRKTEKIKTHNRALSKISMKLYS